MDALLIALGLAAVVLAATALGVALRALRGSEPRRMASPVPGARSMAPATAGQVSAEARGPATEAALRDAGTARGSVGIGLVRFNAFDDTGGNQSFALALLDGAGDGLVLSSLHSRQSTRLYVKHVAAGSPDAPLSGEESVALQEALGKLGAAG